MPAIRISCQELPKNISSQVALGSIMGTNSTTFDDSTGAMRFTIAVVLVYGIGVIGLLGISARRSRRKEMLDQEVHNYIKSKLYQYTDKMPRNKKKKTIYKLISSVHNTSRQSFTDSTHSAKEKSVSSAKVTVSIPKLSRASTWSGHLSAQQHDNRSGLPTVESVPFLSQADPPPTTLPLSSEGKGQGLCLIKEEQTKNSTQPSTSDQNCGTVGFYRRPVDISSLQIQGGAKKCVSFQDFDSRLNETKQDQSVRQVSRQTQFNDWEGSCIRQTDDASNV